MKIKKTHVFAAFALITGIIGAVLRANYLLTGFEAETGLPLRSENRYETALFVLSAFVFIVFFIFSVSPRRKPGDFCGEEICSLNGAGLLLRVLSAFLMLLASVFGFCQFMLNNG
ncbi:MAG: hypothetical protein Q8878_07775, partial [Bacillota bacterium]|nr:hypothetical protein [Bacillota bacterium]